MEAGSGLIQLPDPHRRPVAIPCLQPQNLTAEFGGPVQLLRKQALSVPGASATMQSSPAQCWSRPRIHAAEWPRQHPPASRSRLHTCLAPPIRGTIRVCAGWLTSAFQGHGIPGTSPVLSVSPSGQAGCLSQRINNGGKGPQNHCTGRFFHEDI